MNLFSKILAKCGGAHPETLKKCPSESSKYASVGITIIFTGIFAALSGGYAFYKIFNKEITTVTGQVEDTFFYGAILMGLLWGFMIFNLDRFIVMSMKKKNELWREFLTATPRVVLAIIISLVVAKPLEVRLFQDRIAAQISDNELTKREQNRSRIFEITGKEKIDSLDSKNQANILSLQEQLGSDCPTQECQTAAQAQRASYDKYISARNRVQPGINDAERNIRFINNGSKYKVTSIVDGIEQVRLSDEGKRQLSIYERQRDNYIAERRRYYNIYLERKREFERLESAYKESLEMKLNTTRLEGEQLAMEKATADSLTFSLTEKSSEAASIAYTNNFITQIEALGDLTEWKYDKLDSDGNVIEKANNTMWYMNIAIILLFIIIETAPVFVKLISSKGQYDIAIEAEDTKKESEFIHEANTEIAIAEQKSQLQLQVLMNNQQAQLGMLQSAIQSWQNQKTSELNNGTLSDAQYRKIIQEILDFEIINSKSESKVDKRRNGFLKKFINIILKRISRGTTTPT